MNFFQKKVNINALDEEKFSKKLKLTIVSWFTMVELFVFFIKKGFICDTNLVHDFGNGKVS